MKSNAPQSPGVPSAGFAVTRAETNETAKSRERLEEISRSSCHISCLPGSHAVGMVQAKCLCLAAAGFMQSWQLPALHPLLGAIPLRVPFSSLSAALELWFCFPHHPEFCLSLSKLNKENNNIIGRNFPKLAFLFLQ